MHLLLAAVLAGLPAGAGMVTSPPPGAREVGLLLCAGEACSDRMFWVSHDPAFANLPVVVVEALLADNVAATRDEAAAEAFRDALDRARLALLDGRRIVADSALNDAERALALWAGTPTNQEQFTLWFLRGAAALEAGMERVAAAELRRAAATTWNRSVALPPGTERWAEPYYAQVEALLAEGTGTLVIEDAGSTLRYSLDGVDLGPGPVRVNVFPGTHRLAATNSRDAHTWQQDVEIVAGRTAAVQARLAEDDDAQWATFELFMAFDTMELPAEVAALLDQWADRHQVATLRLLRLDPEYRLVQDEIDREVGGAMPTFNVRQIRYDPALRRMTPLD